MCTVSMIMDHYGDKWSKPPYQLQPVYPPALAWPPLTPEPRITQAELDEFRTLLERAREYDKRNNEPDCELESKKVKVKKLAEELGVEISFL